MLNNKYRNNKNKNKMPFKSHTDINNYNNFLLELDKKNMEQTIDKEEQTIAKEEQTKLEKELSGFKGLYSPFSS